MNSDDEDDEETISCEDFQPIKDCSFNRSTSMSDNLSNPANSLPIQTTKPIPSELLTTIGRKTVLARAELWDRRININEAETNQIPISYDIEQWSHEFDKIHNLN